MKCPKTCGIAVAAQLLLWTATTATADTARQVSLKYFEQRGYQDELLLCADLLRPVLAAGQGDRVSYVVDEIELRGPWYRFEIAATVVSAAGETVLEDYRVGCKSNRWIESARLLARHNAQELPVDLAQLAYNWR